MSVPASTNFANEPFVAAIAGRIRQLIRRTGACGVSDVGELSERLRIPTDDLRALLEHHRLIDMSLLVDVIAGAVRACGIDPHWLLTGEYDTASHRDALELAEEEASPNEGRLRDYVRRKLDAARAPVALREELRHAC